MDAHKRRRQADPYRVLNVSRDADEKEIDRAWAVSLKKAQKGSWHYRVEDVNRARALLKDPKERARWDLENPVYPLEPLPDPSGEVSAEALHLPLVAPPLGPEFDEIKLDLPDRTDILARFNDLPPELKQLADPRAFIAEALQELQGDDPWEPGEGGTWS